MDSTPATLLERLRRPADERDWERFTQLYTPLLFYWARQLGLRESDAADLVQDVFVVLLKQLPGFRYDASGRFRGWLWTVLVNQFRTGRRRLAARPAEVTLEGLSTKAARDDDVPLEEREFRQYLVTRAMQIMQADFDPTTWKACWEFAVNARPAGAVAAELGVSVNAVYLAKARVLRRLREELAGMLD